MDLNEWLALPEEERAARCQHLNAYEEWDLFKAIEAQFIEKHAGQSGVGEVFCGISGTVGAFHAIRVEIVPGQKRACLPKRFLGFPVERHYSRK